MVSPAEVFGNESNKSEATEVPVGYKVFTWNGENFKVKEKFKRLKFLRLISEDPVGAIELAFDPKDIEEIEDREMTQDELESFLEIVATTLLGKSEE
jgi:hypothetical protein